MWSLHHLSGEREKEECEEVRKRERTSFFLLLFRYIVQRLKTIRDYKRRACCGGREKREMERGRERGPSDIHAS